ncbi:MAG: (2Fe-2S)-binding protein [Acidobacteria bacterium]|nr:(2Fe-2S)-binding protein [Acidobacteriota bacterium]
MITISINRKQVSVADGTTVAAAVLNAGETAFRTSVSREARSPLCGMGICFECRLTINGEPHIRSCTLLAEDGMEVVTGE